MLKDFGMEDANSVLTPMDPHVFLEENKETGGDVLASQNYATAIGTLLYAAHAIYCIKKVLTSRISGPDKYQQVVLGVHRGVYGSMVNCCEDYGAFLDRWR
jgi:hypothetical protein